MNLFKKVDYFYKKAQELRGGEFEYLSGKAVPEFGYPHRSVRELADSCSEEVRDSSEIPADVKTRLVNMFGNVKTFNDQKLTESCEGVLRYMMDQVRMLADETSKLNLFHVYNDLYKDMEKIWNDLSKHSFITGSKPKEPNASRSFTQIKEKFDEESGTFQDLVKRLDELIKSVDVISKKDHTILKGGDALEWTKHLIFLRSELEYLEKLKKYFMGLPAKAKVADSASIKKLEEMVSSEESKMNNYKSVQLLIDPVTGKFKPMDPEFSNVNLFSGRKE